MTYVTSYPELKASVRANYPNMHSRRICQDRMFILGNRPFFPKRHKILNPKDFFFFRICDAEKHNFFSWTMWKGQK